MGGTCLVPLFTERLMRDGKVIAYVLTSRPTASSSAGGNQSSPCTLKTYVRKSGNERIMDAPPKDGDDFR